MQTRFDRLAALRATALAGALLLACTSSSPGQGGSAPLAVSPATSDAAPGDLIKFQAVQGTADVSVAWTVEEQQGGTIDAQGTYTAPAMEGTYHVVARSTAGVASTAEVRVKQRAPQAVALSPHAATVVAGGTLEFTVRMSGLASSDATWSVQEGSAGGTISAAGAYVAPQTAGTYHVIATSAADPTKTDLASVTVQAAQAAPPSAATPPDPTSPPAQTPSTTPPAATGPQYFVATNGNDANPGTIDQPWRTIQKAMNSARPGDTVNVRAGTYQERVNVNVSGTPGNYITLQNYGFTAPNGSALYPGPAGGEQVVVDLAYLGTTTDGVPFLNFEGRSYVRIQGITFQNHTTNGGGPQFGLLISNSSFIEVKSCRLLHLKNVGPWDGTAATEPFFVRHGSHDVWLYGNEEGDVVTLYSEALTADDASYNVTIEHNWIHDTDAIGIDLNQNTYNNVVRANLLEYIGKKRDGTVWYNNPAQAIYVQGGTQAVIEGNMVRNSCDAFGVDSEPGYPVAHDIVFRNNVAYSCTQGIKLGTWYSSTDTSRVYNVSAYNNTLYQVGDGIVIRPMSGTNRVENNIVVGGSGYSNSGNWPVTSIDYNLYYQVGSVGPDAHGVRADPGFANPAGGDFSLTPGSPGIGAGDPGASADVEGSLDFAGDARIAGGRIDIGAYEAP